MQKSQGLVNKKTTTANQQQEIEKEFLMWLQQKLQVKTEEELKQKLEELGEEGLQEAYKMFQTEKQQMSKTMMQNGGKFNKIENLLKFKCGGKMKKGKKESGGKVKKLPLYTKGCCK